MDVYLNHGSGFFVPSSVAEYFLKLATHQQLKVLLYILAHQGQHLSTDEIARQCGVQPDHVEEALVFWQQVNVLASNEAAPAAMITPSAASAQQNEPVAVTPAAAVSAADNASVQETKPASAGLMTTSGSFEVRPAEIAERAKSDSALAAMLSAAEQYAGRPLRHTELRSLFWMHDYLGLTPDTILMLLAFCRQENLFQVRYMEQVALEWHDRGVLSHEQVQQDIQRRTEARSFTGKIMKMFEMSRNPTERQQAYISDWQQKGDSLELIRLAYERTRESCDDKLKFSYLDSILKRWRADGLKTRAQVEHNEQIFRQQKTNSNQASSSAAGRGSQGGTDGAHSYDLEDLKSLKNCF